MSFSEIVYCLKCKELNIQMDKAFIRKLVEYSESFSTSDLSSVC